MYSRRTSHVYQAPIYWLLLLITLTFTASASTAAGSNEQAAKPWPLWISFKQQMISKDGRVIDYYSDNAYTTSEGQSYAMFFALVANEKKQFHQLFRWTQNNLAAGNLAKQLPAWQWGKKGSNWQVIDSNSASDSDLWIAYCLLEAGRLWQNDEYRQVGLALAEQILAKETADIPHLGLTLLPAPIGFTLTDDSWKLNPSYVPLQLLRALYLHSEDIRWLQLIESSQQLIIDTAPKGYSPDWVVYHADSGFERQSRQGSYNAIRVYLWAGMLHPDDNYREPQLRQLNPMAVYIAQHGHPPEYTYNQTGKTKDIGPIGFSAALLPFLQANQAHKALATQLIRLIKQPLTEIPTHYYNNVLALFALAFIEQRYHFDANGQLIVPWYQPPAKPSENNEGSQ